MDKRVNSRSENIVKANDGVFVMTVDEFISQFD